MDLMDLDGVSLIPRKIYNYDMSIDILIFSFKENEAENKLS